jgi:putative transposase
MSKHTYRSSRNVVHLAKYHLAWCPTYRRRVLAGAVEARLARIIREVCAEHQVEVLGLEIMPDHVHLLTEMNPSFGVSRLMRFVKGRSSRVLREELPHLRRLPSLPTSSWFVSTLGGAPLSVMKPHVSNQKVA